MKKTIGLMTFMLCLGLMVPQLSFGEFTVANTEVQAQQNVVQSKAQDKINAINVLLQDMGIQLNTTQVRAGSGPGVQLGCLSKCQDKNGNWEISCPCSELSCGGSCSCMMMPDVGPGGQPTESCGPIFCCDGGGGGGSGGHGEDIDPHL